jgi:nucleolar pre-ribosomal-associated protein 1
VVSTLSTLITLLSSHYEHHSFCQDILKNLLSDNWSHRLNSYLGSTHSELILVTLKLYNAASNFAAGRERRAVMDAFSWDAKVRTGSLAKNKQT